jgi:hypothetical protein
MQAPPEKHVVDKIIALANKLTAQDY